MKSTPALWTVLALTALLLSAQAGAADQKPRKATAKYYEPTTSTVDQTLIKELVEIINKTDSPTTFALTVMALEQLGDQAKSTVPTIIRNAERLNIFSAANAMVATNGPPSKKQQLANVVAQAIVHLLSGNRVAPPPPAPSVVGMPAQRWSAPPPAPSIIAY